MRTKIVVMVGCLLLPVCGGAIPPAKAGDLCESARPIGPLAPSMPVTRAAEHPSCPPFGILPTWDGGFEACAGTNWRPGGFVLVGDLTGPCVWGRDPGELAGGTPASHDAALVSFSADGTPRGVVVVGGHGEQRLLDVTTAPGGTLLLTGHHEGGAVLLGTEAPSAPSERVQACVALVDSTERGRWLEPPVQVAHRWSSGRRCISLVSGRLLVVGEMAESDDVETFARLYAADGTRERLVRLPGAFGEDRPAPVSATPDGGFLLARRCLGEKPRTTWTVVTRHHATGEVRWSTDLSASGRLQVTSLAEAAAGSSVVVGWFLGEVELAGRTLTASADGLQGFVLGLDAAGRATWVRHLASTGDAAYAVPLEARVLETGAVEVVGLGHGAVAWTGQDVQRPPLQEAKFFAGLSPDGAPLVLRTLPRTAGRGATVLIVRDRWLGLADAR